MKSPVKLSEEDKNKVAVLYENNTPVPEICKLFDICHESVLNHAKKFNVKMKTLSERSRLYNFNENVFDSIDNEEKAYWLGFLLADGHVNIKKNKLALFIKSTDSDHIEKYKKFLNSETPIKFYTKVEKKRTTYVVGLNVHSKNLINSLVKLGFDGQKTYTGTVPYLREDLKRHFIRGLMDGDGWLSAEGSCLHVGICGNRAVIDWYSQELKNIGIPNTIVRTAPIWKVQVCATRALSLINWLYKDCSIRLNRKYDKFLSFNAYLTEIYNRSFTQGIYFNPKLNKYRVVSIRYDNGFPPKHIGLYETLNEAILIRKEFIENNGFGLGYHLNPKPLHILYPD